MKKYLLLIIAVLTIALVPNIKAAELPEKTDHEKVKVYLFRGKGCSHCYDFLSYFADKYTDYEDYFEIVAYESWNDADNQKLMLAVKELVGEKADGGVPFIVIGNSYHLVGFGKSSGEEIINKALEAYQDKKYTDIVAKAIKDEKVSPNAETIAEAAEKEGIEVKNGTKKTSKGISDKAVIGIVFSALILGFIGLVFMSRK